MSKAEMNVLERRLRPVYDSLDSSNYKKALQETEKVLKKHPTTTAAKVLKALALIRLERLAEAMEIIDALDVAGVKHDDLTLQAFVHCYRDSNQTARIVTLYERAIVVDPSEHNLTMLFMAYTRERMYKEQQKIGLRLFKDVGNVPYYLWSVMSLVMQANENPELGKKMLLPLAEKMFKTQIEKTGYTEGSAAEYELQLLILEGQEKWAECAEFMEKPHATKLPLAPYNLVEKGIEYLTRNEQWEKVDEVGTNALADMSDNWNLWKVLVDSAITQIQKLLENPQKPENLEAAKNHVKRIADLIETHKKKVEWTVRGPYLATFLALKKFTQMAKQIPDFQDFESIFGKIAEKMLEYVEHSYKKPVCFGDLQMFFDFLTAEQKTEFLKGMQAWIRKISAQDDVEEDESKVWAIILVERCGRALGEHAKLDAAAQRSLFQQCIAQIAAPGRSEHAQGVLCNLACAHLWDAYRKDSEFYGELSTNSEIAGRKELV
uniref:N-terminal acetyltransferase B complex subunit MDM20 homolog n=1 Tax=Caenorhabditis japonica TaxID=281687 RepID=A0A8R1HP83_CAEJA